MAINLVDMLSNAVTPNIISGLAGAVGENDSAVKTAVSALLPTILGGLASKASTPSGASSVFSMLTGGNIDTGLLGNLGNMLGSGQTGPLAQMGTSLLSGLFGGDKIGGLGNALASVAGLRASSASSLITLVAPIAFSLIKKVIGEQRLDAGGVVSLLSAQKDNLAGKIDPRLTNALGLGSPTSMLSSIGAQAGAGAHRVASDATATYDRAASAASTATQRSGGIARWLPWAIGAAAVLFALTQLGKRESAPAPQTAQAPAKTAPVATTPSTATAPEPSAARATATIDYPAKIMFDAGKAELSSDASSMIKAVATALAADATKKLGITSFADKAGDAAASAKLAQDRAQIVRTALEAAGIDGGRISLQEPVIVDAAGADSTRVEINVQ